MVQSWALVPTKNSTTHFYVG